jgi:hypothetical protein
VKAPLRILCQHERGSCAACCGAYNFRDRSEAAERARFRRRTDRVRAVWPDVDALAKVRDELLAEEKTDVLFAGVKVCPFAGYVDDERIGCLLHPTRHPRGEDLRDLAVYPREVCAGHYCAPHDWLRDREIDLAQCALGTHYGRVVTDAGLVKAVASLLDTSLGRSFTRPDLSNAKDELATLWARFARWPYADPDPARFGGFHFAGDDAVERTIPSCTTLAVSNAMRTVLDGLGTRALDDAEAARAVALVESWIGEAAQKLAGTHSPSEQ